MAITIKSINGISVNSTTNKGFDHVRVMRDAIEFDGMDIEDAINEVADSMDKVGETFAALLSYCNGYKDYEQRAFDLLNEMLNEYINEK